jgi:hypothetical protein
MKLLDILKEIDNADLGKVVFGGPKDEPEFAKMQGAKPGSEPNTPEEQKLLKALKAWVVSPKLGVKDLENLSKLIKVAAEKYPKILKPKTPNGTPLFRGLKNASPEIIDLVKQSKPEDWVYNKGMYLLKNPINYTPRSQVQSWTTDRQTASGVFGPEGLLITRQSDEFYFNQDIFHKLYGQREDEVLHFGVKYDTPIYLGVIIGTKLTRKFPKKFEKISKDVQDTGSEVEKIYAK